MKPRRNIVFCHGSNRKKMIFDSQSKADNFIKYNRDEILEENGKAPIRSYYCELCCGYHVTSNPSSESGEYFAALVHKRLDNVINMHKGSDEAKSLFDSLGKSIEKAESFLYVGDFAEASKLLDFCNNCIHDIRAISPNGNNKLTDMRVKVDDLAELLHIINDYQDLSSNEADLFLQSIEKEKVGDSIKTIFHYKSLIDEVKKTLSSNEELFENGKLEDVLANINICLRHLAYLKGTKAKKAVGAYRNLLERQIQRHKKIIKRKLKKELEKAKEAERRQEREKHEANKNKDSEKYRKNILSLIERLENIKSLYEQGNIEECQKLLDYGILILDEMGRNDSNTELLRNHYNQWAEILRQ